MTSVKEYLAAQPPAGRRALTHVRRAIRAAIPGAEEVISYQIPAYKLEGRVVIYFAAWKEHYSIYPVSSGVLKAFAGDLAACHVSKGTLRFPLDQPVPVTL